MLYLVCLGCILSICVNAEYTVKCNDGKNINSTNVVSLEPSPDNVKGRYVMLWCTEVNEHVAKWEYYIDFNPARKPDRCKHDVKRPINFNNHHSHLEQDVNVNTNCSHVCLSTTIDLIFETCYAIKNQLFTKDKHTMEINDTLIYITNNFVNISTLQKSKPLFKHIEYNDYVTAMFYLGNVPAVNYMVELQRLLNSTTDTAQEGLDVTENCTSEVYIVRCRLYVPHGNYQLWLMHNTPWRYGNVTSAVAIANFSYSGELPVTVTAEGGGALHWGLAGAGVAVALCVVALLLHHRRTAKTTKEAQGVERVGVDTGAGAGDEAGEGGGVRVLLLYARDCPALLVAARRLAALLNHVAPDRVYDLYEPKVSAQAAAAPGDWLRALLGREDVRVVLLQTPAAACLYATQLRQRGYTLALEQPLLGSRVVPRRPHCADSLLQLALRLLCEGAAQGAHLDTHYPYKKYYVADICGLEANVVPLVTPQRRYVLPAATALLLRDLAADGPQPAQPVQLEEELAQLERQLAEPLRQFSQAVDELLDYVAENPDYLNDELIFL